MRLLADVLNSEWRAGSVLETLKNHYYITWSTSIGSSGGGRLPPFGKVLQCVKPEFIENLLVKAINRFNAENYEIRALPFTELLVKIFSPRVSRSYSLKHFRNDLKTVMQEAGIEGQQMIVLLEDHQLLEAAFLELVNSLLSAGEIPGLYSPEELEPLLAPIREDCLQENFKVESVEIFLKFAKRLISSVSRLKPVIAGF